MSVQFWVAMGPEYTAAARAAFMTEPIDTDEIPADGVPGDELPEEAEPIEDEA